MSSMSSQDSYKGNTWSFVETTCLINLWSEEKIEADLSGTHRNRHVYEKLSYMMREHGYLRPWDACRTKIKSLRTIYLKAKNQNSTSGQERTKFPFFEQIDSLMGTRPIVQPDYVVNAGSESLNIDSGVESETVINTDDVQETETQDATDAEETEDSGRKTKEDLKNISKTQNKQRKRKNEDVFDKFMNSFVQMEAAQTKIFFEQEEKRRKAEDSIELQRMEMDRRFQMQMFQMQTKLQMDMLSLFGQSTEKSVNVPSPRGDGDDFSSEMKRAMNCTNLDGSYPHLNTCKLTNNVVSFLFASKTIIFKVQHINSGASVAGNLCI